MSISIFTINKIAKSYDLISAKIVSKFKRTKIQQKDKRKFVFDLYTELLNGEYKAKPLKKVQIPKSDGSKRDLKIPCFKDKVLQKIISDFLNKKLNGIFSNRSYAYRPKKTPKQAVNRVVNNCKRFKWVIDIDITKFFDTIDHDLLIQFLKKYISDEKVIELIDQWIKIGDDSENELKVKNHSVGIPQGSSISPILANLFLHEVFDKWFENEFPNSEFVRYADDIVVHCTNVKEAQAIFGAIINRFTYFKLQLHKKKSKIVYCRRNHKRKSFYKKWKRSFIFLGFKISEEYILNSKNQFIHQISPRVNDEKCNEIFQIIMNIQRNVKLYIRLLVKLLNLKLLGVLNYYTALDYHFRERIKFKLNKLIFYSFKRTLPLKTQKIKWLILFLFKKFVLANSTRFFLWKNGASFIKELEKKRVRFV